MHQTIADHREVEGEVPSPIQHPTQRVYAGFVIAAAQRHGPRPAVASRHHIKKLIAQAEQLYRDLPRAK